MDMMVLLSKTELENIISDTVTKTIEKLNETNKPTSENTKFITPEEFGETTGRHAVTIRRWINEGKINGYKMGGRLMIDKDEAAATIRKKSVSVRQFAES